MAKKSYPLSTILARRRAQEKQRNKPEYKEKYNTWYNAKLKSNPEWAKKRRAYKATPISRYKQMLSQAKTRKIECSISFENYVELTSTACVYCGGPLPVDAIGLDRKDTTAGYHPGNVAACCGICNRVKGSMFTYDEMKLLGTVVKEIRENRNTPIRYRWRKEMAS